MSLNDNKLKLCNKYEDYLQLIYIIGNGVMFKKQVEDFAQKFLYISRTSVQDILKELRACDILDFIQYQRAVVIKLKKFALQYLKKCKKESVSSLNVTPTKIKKSAYKSSILLDLYAKIEKPVLKDLFSIMEERSTFLLKEREGYKLLNLFNSCYKNPNDVKMEANVYEKCSVNSKLNINYKQENMVKYIPDIEAKLIGESEPKSEVDIKYNLANYKVGYEESFNEQMVMEQKYSANSIIQGYTNIFYNPKNKQMVVYILDMYDSVSVNVLTKKIINFYNYMAVKLKDDITLKFRICVSSANRQKKFYEQADKFDKAFIKANLTNKIIYSIKNLSISSLFLNRKIAIASETNETPVLYVREKSLKELLMLKSNGRPQGAKNKPKKPTIKAEPIARLSTVDLKLKRELDEERQIQEARRKQLKELETDDEY